jgi:hypothetical protein
MLMILPTGVESKKRIEECSMLEDMTDEKLKAKL